MTTRLAVCVAVILALSGVVSPFVACGTTSCTGDLCLNRAFFHGQVAFSANTESLEVRICRNSNCNVGTVAVRNEACAELGTAPSVDVSSTACLMLADASATWILNVSVLLGSGGPKPVEDAYDVTVTEMPSNASVLELHKRVSYVTATREAGCVLCWGAETAF
jgi:hypothetical protein